MLHAWLAGHAHRSGGLNVAVRELLGHYMALEEAYMGETTAMAIRIDEVGALYVSGVPVEVSHIITHTHTHTHSLTLRKVYETACLKESGHSMITVGL